MTNTSTARDTFSDAYKGACNWQGVNQMEVKENIEATMKTIKKIWRASTPMYQVLTKSARNWIRRRRIVDQHGCDDMDLLNEKISFYSDHLALGYQLKPDHKDIYDFFNGIEGHLRFLQEHLA
jgi:hypothetical protein